MVNDATTIDLVARDPRTGGAVLVMVEDRPWGDRGELLFELQDKLNTYIAFIQDGSLAKMRSDFTGAFRIELRTVHAPTERESELLRVVESEVLVKMGGKCGWVHL
jgi:hypothetical protein